MLVTISWRAAAAALDAGTAVFAAVNAAYFVTRLGGAGAESPARRAALFVLAVVCLGVLIEALSCSPFSRQAIRRRSSRRHSGQPRTCWPASVAAASAR